MYISLSFARRERERERERERQRDRDRERGGDRERENTSPQRKTFYILTEVFCIPIVQQNFIGPPPPNKDFNLSTEILFPQPSKREIPHLGQAAKKEYIRY